MNTRFKSVGSNELATLAVYNSRVTQNLVRAIYCSYCSMGVKKVQHTAAQYRLKHTIPQTASLAPCSVTFIVHIVYVKGVSMWQGTVSNFKEFTVLVGTVSDLQSHFPFDTPTQGDINTNTSACRHQNYCFLWWHLCEPDYNDNYCKKIIVIL